MDEIRFSSIGNPNIMYVWKKDTENNDGFYRNPGCFVSNTTYQFNTYGDRTTQHSPLYLVSAQSIDDFMCSLALHVAANPTPEMYECFSYNLHLNHVSQEAVQFLFDLRPGNGKPAFYNLAERKRSTKATLEHDKRWEKVPDNFKGSFGDLWSILCPSWFGLLDRLYLAETIRKHTNWSIWLDYEEFFQVSRQSQLFYAMNILEAFVVGMQKLDFVSRCADGLRNNLGLNKE